MRNLIKENKRRTKTVNNISHHRHRRPAQTAKREKKKSEKTQKSFRISDEISFHLDCCVCAAAACGTKQQSNLQSNALHD